jgi:hypothetical protein
MVWLRMGLLDDAIREHLELKRRRGADPGEVAREQREALDAVPRNPTAQVEEGGLDRAAGERDAQGDAPLGAPGVAPVAAIPDEDNAAQAGQAGGTEAGDMAETAELDMGAVLGQDEQGGSTEQALQREATIEDPARGDADAASQEEDSLEWELPGDHSDERSDAEEPDEDVLEETPDFLRDTPEQERLWFEQRPPRDFDFDK